MSSHNPLFPATTEPVSRDEPLIEAATPQSSNESPSTVKSDESQSGKPQNEIGGRGGLEPTRYGDWEKAGRCIDF